MCIRDRLKTLADRFEPFIMSEHLAWSRGGGVYHPDLLPFPRTRQMLKRVSDNVARAQDALGRRLLIENPSLYLDLKGHEMGEVDFLVELAAATGCGLLLDLNNVHISANNLGADPRDYLATVPADLIGEIHLAGFAPDPVHAEALLIDTHDAPVSDTVWSLYAQTLARIGPRPTLIERDDNIPDFAELIAERDQAVAIMEACHVQCAA